MIPGIVVSTAGCHAAIGVERDQDIDVGAALAVAKPQRLAALAAYGVLDTPPERGFDDLVQLAADLCAAPVALVSFVAADRQWFKARVGFPRCETDLDSSVCRFVLVELDLLVIPDLELDARTADNPLVTGEPGIRFYAGAPLRTGAGDVLGSLCVIDTEPRPLGLTERQADGLKRLARQVMDQLEVRRMVAERDDALARQADAAAALARSEARWRGLFEDLQEGFVLARPVRGEGGRIEDWRYLDVNRAWGELVGIDGREAVGRTIREVLPGVEQEWIDLAYVVDDGGTVTFTRQVGQLGRWYDGRASAVDEDTFLILFLDVTDRIQAERALAESGARKSALAELGDLLRATHDAAAMGHVAATIMGRTLDASRAGYGQVDARRERIEVLADWCAPGVVSIAGVLDFRDFGSYVDDLKLGRLVVISDVRQDPSTGETADALHAIGIAALVNVPVVENGELVAVSFVNFDHPRSMMPEELAFIRAVADRTRVGVARLRAEERQAVLNGEISHRLKNTLAMVQAITGQTLKGAVDSTVLRTLDDRLLALGRAHDVLLKTEWEAADLHAIVDEVLALAGAQGRYAAAGPPVRLGARATLSVSLLVHELATNARKYGALSADAGRVEIAWRLEGDDDAELVVDWREVGGPPAAPPTRKGFGSRLLRIGLVGTGGSELHYDGSGFSASFRASRRQVEQA